MTSEEIQLGRRAVTFFMAGNSHQMPYDLLSPESRRWWNDFAKAVSADAVQNCVIEGERREHVKELEVEKLGSALSLALTEGRHIFHRSWVMLTGMKALLASRIEIPDALVEYIPEKEAA